MVALDPRLLGASGCRAFTTLPFLNARVIPTAWEKFMKTSATENPLLKVPPASRGNRTRVRFPSRSGGNLRRGAIVNSARAIGKCLCDMIATCESGRHKTCPYKVGVAAPP